MKYRDFWRRLTAIYDECEAKDIASLVYERRFSLSLTDICMGEDGRMSDVDNKAAEEILYRLLRNEPVQYILGGGYFLQNWYDVKPGILIPRPETAALVEWIARDMKENNTCSITDYDGESLHLLDCCCGSGCIGIELKYMFPAMRVSAYDISDVAIEVTHENAKRIACEVEVFPMDALNPSACADRYDIIVSNPPYVCESEKAGMRSNVLDYEPAMALFVPDDDPLRFYRAIALYAFQSLKPNGMLYFEINPLFVKEMCDMLEETGFSKITVDEASGYVNRLMRATC